PARILWAARSEDRQGVRPPEWWRRIRLRGDKGRWHLGHKSPNRPVGCIRAFHTSRAAEARPQGRQSSGAGWTKRRDQPAAERLGRLRKPPGALQPLPTPALADRYTRDRFQASLPPGPVLQQTDSGQRAVQGLQHGPIRGPCP